MIQLVIVESPTKAKTIGKFLGKGFRVKSSKGHVRDLPKSGINIDTEGGTFLPTYEIPEKAQKVVAELKKDANVADEIYFATDEDREGEAIAWHLAHVLRIPIPKTKRIVFHEITKQAITNALAHPRTIDQHLTDAQQARRILDRLVGYKLSPFLWNKIRFGLSAGRVQSVAVRLVVEREEEIRAFAPQTYYLITGTFAPAAKPKAVFEGVLYKRNGTLLKKLSIADKADAEKIVAEARKSKFVVSELTKKDQTRHPGPPFTTSTLQQAASSSFGYSARQTMQIAQKLYEGIAVGEEGSVGLITYMRTDSVALAKEAVAEARAVIGKNFGKDYVPATTNVYKSRSKNAQEAHEAIRPTSFARTPESIADYLDAQQLKIYRLIWQRAMASQMADAKTDATIALLEGGSLTFRARGAVLRFPGYLAAYGGSPSEKDVILPELKEKEPVNLNDITSEQKQTEPPARYSEATLIKALEEHGIGRPSTYAPTIQTIIARKYVEKKIEDKKLHPTETGELVNRVLVEHFPQIVDLAFTATMEADLDEIALGKKEWKPVVEDFYGPFIENLKKKTKEVDKKALTEEQLKEKCPKCGKHLVRKLGRYGKFVTCSGYPDCDYKEVTEEEKKLQEEFKDEKCEECGKHMTVKHGKYGAFLGCSDYPTCKGIKRIDKKTGLTCPKCNKGDIVERTSKRGRLFYGCNQYPACDYVLWQKPTGKMCPTCGKPTVFAPKGEIRCSDKTCAYRIQQDEAETPSTP